MPDAFAPAGRPLITDSPCPECQGRVVKIAVERTYALYLRCDDCSHVWSIAEGQQPRRSPESRPNSQPQRNWVIHSRRGRASDTQRARSPLATAARASYCPAHVWGKPSRQDASRSSAAAAVPGSGR